MNDNLKLVEELINEVLDAHGVSLDVYSHCDLSSIELYDLDTGEDIEFTYTKGKPPACAEGEHEYSYGMNATKIGELGHTFVYECLICREQKTETHGRGPTELVANGFIQQTYCDHYDKGCKNPIISKEIT